MKITGHRTRSVFDRYDISSNTDVREGLGSLKSTMGTVSGTGRLMQGLVPTGNREFPSKL
jgi:hypothetical protein